MSDDVVTEGEFGRLVCSGGGVFGSDLVFPDDRFNGEACQQYLKQATTPKREK